MNNEFKAEYNVTIGVEFHSHTLYLNEYNNVPMTLQIWDTVYLFIFKTKFKIYELFNSRNFNLFQNKKNKFRT